MTTFFLSKKGRIVKKKFGKGGKKGRKKERESDWKIEEEVLVELSLEFCLLGIRRGEGCLM